VSARGLTARRIAALVGGELLGSPDVLVAGAAPLPDAGPGDVSFLATGRHVPALAASRAGVVLLAAAFRGAPGPPTRVVVADPRAALATVLAALHPAAPPRWDVHPTARLGPRCRWRGRLALGPHAVLGHDVQLGTDCRLGAHVEIADGARLGDHCRLDDGVSIGPGVELGHRVAVQSGARIGTDGFGYVAAEDGHTRLPHVGACRVGDDVEIGANTTVDRGSIGATVIGAGTKIDNLVHVAHNVRIGARCVIMAQVGLAGSTIVGDDVLIAGQAGLAGQLRVGDGARVAAQSGVIGDVRAGATVSGYPARDHRAVLRQAAALARLTPHVATLEHLVQSHDDRLPTHAR